MAHTKSGGSKAYQGARVSGKRLGIKISGGSEIKTGQIILRQRGSTVKPGEGVGMGKDYTIYAKRPGVVKFGNVDKKKKKVSVV